MTPELWLAALDRTPAEQERLCGTLSPAECERAARFRFEVDRRRWAVARGLLRDLLARRLGFRPEQLRLASGPLGKPFLPDAPHLRFSLSHSGDLALVAISADHEIGVDLEYMDAARARIEFAAEYLPPADRAALAALDAPLRDSAFFRAWTRREAIAKAAGTGLSAPFDLAGWRVFSFRPRESYWAALALPATAGWLTVSR